MLGIAADEVSEISTPKGVALATVELEQAESEGQPLRMFTVIKRGPAEGEVCCLCVCVCVCVCVRAGGQPQRSHCLNGAGPAYGEVLPTQSRI